MTPAESLTESTEPWTVDRVLRFASQDLAKRKVSETPRLEAEVLLAHVLSLPRIRLILERERPLDEQELTQYRECLQRRRRHEPVAYIVGEREFYGHPFFVNRHTLIPRPDTEILVEVALSRTASRDLYGHALDLCTGSGCVAISFSKERPTWEVTGSDVSDAALGVARRNALRLGATWNLAFVQSDLFAQIPKATRFDLIVANPPYITDEEMKELQPDISQHEPELALRGGKDGLDLARQLVKQALEHLAPGGVLALELGSEQVGRVAAGLQKWGFSDIRTHKDYGARDRVVSAALPAQRPIQRSGS